MSRRLTREALKWLLENISVRKYESEHTDWPAILDKQFGAGVWYADEGNPGRYVFDDKREHEDAFEVADPRQFRKDNHADERIAIPFYENAKWSAAEVFDAKYLAYVTHVHMHRFNIHRWQSVKPKDENKEDWIRLHWFAGKTLWRATGPAVYKSNSAGRLWWLAHMSAEAAKYQARGQVLKKFCEKVDLYHETMSR